MRMNHQAYCKIYKNTSLNAIISAGLGNFGLTAANYSYNSAQFKSYKLDDTNDMSGDPFLQYLVQYNETFLNFASRVANRMGQYLFFEKGKLQYPQLESPTNYTISSQSSLLDNAIIDYSDIIYKNGPNVAYSYLNYCNKTNIRNKNETDVRYNREDFEEGQLCVYDDSDNYDSSKDILTTGIMNVAALGAMAQAGNLVDAVAMPGGSAVITTKQRSWCQTDLNDDFKKLTKDTTEKDSTKQTADAKEQILIHTKQTEHNLPTNIFFSNVEQSQIAAEKKSVTIQFSDNPNPILLGDTFSDGSSKYDIVEVSATWEFVKITKNEGTKVTIIDTPHSSHKARGILTVGTTYRPETRIRKSGPQRAFVSKVSDPLRIGRVRIYYPWDKDKTDSPWIRVAMPAAYDGGGFCMPPEEGNEVIVNYENGNIECPFVEGYFHDRYKKPFQGSKPLGKKSGNYMLVDGNKNGDFCICNKTGQSISLNNGNGASTLFINKCLPGSFKPFIMGFKADTKDKYLGGSIVLSDSYGITSITEDTAARAITIDSPLGTITMNAFEGIKLSAPNGNIKISGKNITLEASNNINLVSGKNKGNVGYYTIAHNISKGLIDLGLDIASAKCIYKTGSDHLKVLNLGTVRSIFEVIVRPLEGTTSISTPGYIIFTAKGAGSAAEKVYENGKSSCSLIQDISLSAPSNSKKFKKWLKEEQDDNFSHKRNAKLVFSGVGMGVLDSLAEHTGLKDTADFIDDQTKEFHCNIGTAIDTDDSNRGGIFAKSGDNWVDLGKDKDESVDFIEVKEKKEEKEEEKEEDK